LRRLGKFPYRLELWEEMVRAIRAFDRGGHESLREAAWHVRDITRQVGRKHERRTVSRTLLVKGLEYDRALVLDAGAHNAQNIYVALTRGRKGVVVISESPAMTFQPAPGSTLSDLII
jgi:DNA helicase-2/ATP-dependent DNA helicase PcrA